MNRFRIQVEMACANELDGCESKIMLFVPIERVLELRTFPTDKELFPLPEKPAGWKYMDWGKAPHMGLHCPQCVVDPRRFDEEEDDEDD